MVIKNLPKNIYDDRRTRYALRYLYVITRHKKILGMTVLTSLIAQILYFLAIYVITLSAGVDISFTALIAVLPVVALIASIPLGIGGWGVREGAFIFGLGLLGVPLETAFLASVQIGLIGMMTTLLAGLPMIMTMDFTSLKYQAQTLAARLNRVTIKR